MSQGVKSFAELYKLFGAKENDMGATRKRTPDRLDKIIQFIHHYQNEHDGATPSQRLIGNELDVPEAGISYYITLLINDNRIERISARPFRIRILEHPKNRAAIRRLEKALTAAAEAEAARNPQPTGGADTPTSPGAKVEPNSAEENYIGIAQVEIPRPVVADASIVGGIPAPERPPLPPAAVFGRLPSWITQRPPQSWRDVEEIVNGLGGNLDAIASTYVLKTAKPGELLEQLLDRGYTVAKTHPSWR